MEPVLNFDHLIFGHTVLHPNRPDAKHTDIVIVIERLGNSWVPPLPPGFAVGETALLGVPRGGAWVVKRLRQSWWIGRCRKGSQVVVVDDVWTTGASVREFIAAQGLDPKACQVWVIFLRGQPPAEGEFASFAYFSDARRLPLWTAAECPYC